MRRLMTFPNPRDRVADRNLLFRYGPVSRTSISQKVWDPHLAHGAQNASVSEPDPGSGAFLIPGSGIPNPYFSELSDNILDTILCKMAKFVLSFPAQK